MLGGVQFETGGVGPVPYLNILGGTSQKKHPVVLKPEGEEKAGEREEEE